MAKRIKAHFYNLFYYKLEPVYKLAPGVIIGGLIFGIHDDEKIEELKEKFNPSIEIIKEENGWVIYFPAGIRKELKSVINSMGGYFKYDKDTFTRYQDPEGYLYSGWRTGRKTKILPEDLPESYIFLGNYKKCGFLQTEGVKDVFYKPSYFHNHSFKDDFLYLSYTGKIDRNNPYASCDEHVFGLDILDVIFALEKYSPEIETDKIKKEMVKQYNLYCDEMSRPEDKIKTLEELQS